MTWHVTPIEDIQEHDESTTCTCKPTVEFMENGNIVVTHNSFDGREFIEQLTEKENICKN